MFKKYFILCKSIVKINLNDQISKIFQIFNVNYASIHLCKM